ncbi:MAG: hypothetical protein C0506_13305 [Anaerolinea sp.]|nr:hypothetical protein [Anaerolinea sp.]
MMPEIAYREPRWAHLLELNIGDAWRARWVKDEELPQDVPVNFAYGVVYLGDKGYVCRPEGATVWGTVECEPGPGDVETALKAAAREQTGATIEKAVLVGFLYCKATSLNPDFEAGAPTTRPIFILTASKVGDIPDGSPYQRRRLPINEHIKALRERYPEIGAYLSEAAEKYLVLRARGEL